MPDTYLSNQISGPPFSAKLHITMKSGNSFVGTGFHVAHKGREWLLTCRHNIEDRDLNFLGVVDIETLSIVNSDNRVLPDSRTIVGLRVDGHVLDCAAIELFPDEWGSIPKFSTDLKMSMEGSSLPKTITIRGENPEQYIEVEPISFIVLQGYTAPDVVPTTFQGARLPLPVPSHVPGWMVTCLPVCEGGFSGGPILKISNSQISLLAIITNVFPVDAEMTLTDGRVAQFSIQATAGVPIAPLLWALDKHPQGHLIVDVPQPVRGI